MIKLKQLNTNKLEGDNYPLFFKPETGQALYVLESQNSIQWSYKHKRPLHVNCLSYFNLDMEAHFISNENLKYIQKQGFYMVWEVSNNWLQLLDAEKDDMYRLAYNYKTKSLEID